MEKPIEKIEETILGFNYHEIQQWILKVGVDLLLSILILVIGFWLSNVISKTIKNVLKRSNTDESLITFLASLTSTSLKLLVIITSITQFGIEMTSFVALLGAAGLAVGMAFSGTLSNFAGGIMILVFKPFRVGDFIQAQSATGTVKEIQIFNTHIHTIDNKVVILPNGPIANGNITNYTKAERRRIDFVFQLNYGVKYSSLQAIIENYVNQNEKILKDPIPFIGIGNLTNQFVEIHVRVWVETSDYNAVFYDTNAFVYNSFLEKGLEFYQANEVIKN